MSRVPAGPAFFCLCAWPVAYNEEIDPAGAMNSLPNAVTHSVDPRHPRALDDLEDAAALVTRMSTPCLIYWMQCAPGQRSVRFVGAARCLWRISGDQHSVSVTALQFACMEARIRVLVAKPGPDGRDRGAKLIARVLSEYGYGGLSHRPPADA